MVFWAATYGEFLPGQQYSLRLDHATVEPGQRVHARVSSRDPLQGDAIPAATLINPDGSRAPFVLSERPGTHAFWDGFLNPTTPGLYRLQLDAPGEESRAGARALFEVLAPPEESDHLSADPAFLQRLAKRSGGAVFEVDAMAAAWEHVRPKLISVESQEQAIWDPLWDRALLLLAAFLVLAGEWTLRRRSGLL